MQKWIVIVLSIGTLIFLTTRLFYNHADGVKAEKLWYVENLDFHFSATADSLFVFPGNNSGLLYFHLSNGELRLTAEDELKEKLKYHGDLGFILKKPEDKFAFHVINVEKYQQGDSIVVNTDSNRILIYRQRKLTFENEITPCLSGRPF